MVSPGLHYCLKRTDVSSLYEPPVEFEEQKGRKFHSLLHPSLLFLSDTIAKYRDGDTQSLKKKFFCPVLSAVSQFDRGY